MLIGIEPTLAARSAFVNKGAADVRAARVVVVLGHLRNLAETRKLGRPG